MKGPELLGSYVGESEANIRDVFASAREAALSNKNKISILFFDELDSLAPQRGGMGDGGGVMERVVATLLGELDDDQHEQSGQIFMIGATNRPDLLDPSLLRPGRLDRLVYLGLAKTKEDRAKILAAQMRKFTFENNEDVKNVVSRVISMIPENLSGADFSSVASGALMLSIQRLCSHIENMCQHKGMKLNDFLSAQHKEDLIPIVKEEDVIQAARKVAPSIFKADIDRYDALRKTFGG